ncbi:nitrous oxide reductase accessory protein NosL [Adhaeribacter sp. BT258]|uniref:Nitrous oxide reductase accessory protein NosL n=1 Tax=Adhaeribacter terrigena TaxID=2793070 RepID=A0ABS1BZ51_9BACT|nr:nitrous oxide reductase accessory protein NosL [Adhaeribacter terrigena]MBK0402407.1 nitrous oxide reductase accessory protein NosL [Adhaeribacter terrigena]
MKTLFLLLSLPFFALLLSGCEAKQQPIPYGQANCTHCQMTVSDKRYASELVLKTGKALYFDASECMIKYLEDNADAKEKAKMFLVTDFNTPEKLIDADKAIFLQSKNLPSPMGMFLTAFTNRAAATEMQEKNGGRILTWNETVQAVKRNERPE